MRALLRPLFVGGLSLAIAATGLVGSSSVALAASAPKLTTWSLSGSVFEGDRPSVIATFTDGTDQDPYWVDVDWGDGSTADTYALDVGVRAFSVQKSVPYLDDSPVALRISVTLRDPLFANTRFLGVTVLNAVPSITSFALSSATVDAGQAVTATGAFTDAGAADAHTVTVDWGDGSAATSMNLAAAVPTFTSAAHTYAAAGDFTVTATVADNAGATATATATVSVQKPNQAPSIVSFDVTAGSEGGTSTLALTFADADLADSHAVSVDWGDGSTDPGADLSAGVTTFGGTHVFANTGTYSVVLTLSDSAGHTVTASSSVSPTNVAPAVGILSLSPSSVVDHQTLTVSGSFTDPGIADTFTLTLNWGDGTSSSEALSAGTTSFSATHAYNAAGAVTITATVADRDLAKSSSTADLVVLASNHAPANLAVGATALLEGGSTTLDVSFTDAESTDVHTVAITWGDGATESVALSAGATSTGPIHTYLETGTYTVAVTVTDGGGMSVAGGTTVTATNVSPSLSTLAVSPASVTDHQTVTVNGTFSDPGTADTYTVTFAWGDGSTSPQPLAAGARSFSGSHAYVTSGTYNVVVTVTDRDSGSGTQDVSVLVSARNTVPSALALDPSVAAANVTVNATFADPDALDTHVATLTWGDGATTTQTLAAGVTTFTAAHVYGASGTYTINSTVTEPSGASTSATAQVTATVAAASTSDLLDQMSALITSFNLDRNTERWLLRRIDDTTTSLAYGNDQVCSTTGTFAHLLQYAQRTLTTDQYAALSALATQAQTAAGCGSASVRTIKQPTKTVVATTTSDKNTTEKSKKTDAKRSAGRDSR